MRKTHDITVMDETVMKFFLNFTIKAIGTGKKQRYEISDTLKKPWSDFVESNNFEHGRQTNTADEPILLQMFEALLNHQSFKESLDSLNLLVDTLSPHSLTPEKQFLI